MPGDDSSSPDGPGSPGPAGPGDRGAAGLDDTALAALDARARREVDRGQLPSCQIAVARHGDIVLDRTFGAPPESRYVVFSCTKALTAALVWRLLGRGLLSVDTRVATLVEGFGANGKEEVTVEHLLVHTAGFPHERMEPHEWADPGRRLGRFASWQAESAPGTRFEYHGTSAGWVLAHLVEVLTGGDFRDVMRSEVLDPLGLPGLQLGAARGQAAQPAPEPLTMVGEGPDAAAASSLGLDVSAIGSEEPDLLAHDDPAYRAVGQPAGGAVGRAADLALFHQALLSNPGTLWDPSVLRAGTREVRCALPDPMTGVAANRSLGLVVAGDDGNAMMRGFGEGCGPTAFGHMGAGGQVAWADPATGLSVAYLTNGLDRDPLRVGARCHSLSTLAAACVRRSAG